MPRLPYSLNSALRFLMVLALVTGCQRTVVSTTASSQAPRLIVVRGAFYAARDTLKATRGINLVFTRPLPDGAVEKVTDLQMPKTGRYRVRLASGQTYLATLRWRGCAFEEQEYFTGNAAGDSVLVKNFYMDYPDSTHYGGCLTGWGKRDQK